MPGTSGLPRRYSILAVCFSALILWRLFSPSLFPPSTSTSVHTLSANIFSADNSVVSHFHSPYPQIPRKIWQTATPVDQNTLNVHENSWHRLNPYWRYELLNDEGAETFVNETFGRTHPEIVDIYHRIETPIIKVDLLRYLLMLHYGGLYADVEVDCMKPIDSWLSEELRGKAGMILGLEYDDTIHEDMPSVSLAQYIFAARPGHPILEAVLAEALAQLEALGDHAPPNGTPRPGVISASKPQQILEATGPYMFARVIFKTLGQISDFKDPSQLHLIKEPVLFGDVVILPINGFGWGQEHSRSGELDMGEILAQHKFRQSWKNPVTWNLDFSWRPEAKDAGTATRNLQES